MTGRQTKATTIIMTLIGAALSCNGCLGLSKDDGADSGGVVQASTASASVGESAMAAFQTGFYAFATTNCVQCHGVAQNPLFAVGNVSAAYSAAAPFVNFTNPSGSTIVQYAGNGHCGIANCTGTTQSNAVSADITAWAAAAASTGTGSGSGSGSGTCTNVAGLQPASPNIAFTTAPLNIPSGLPGAGNSYALMTWPLSDLTPAVPGLAGAYLQVQIQLLTPNTYKVILPTLAISGNTVGVAGVHLMISAVGSGCAPEEYLQGMNWTSVDTTVEPIVIPSPLPKTPLAATPLTTVTNPLPVLSASDSLVIGFESLEPGN